MIDVDDAGPGLKSVGQLGQCRLKVAGRRDPQRRLVWVAFTPEMSPGRCTASSQACAPKTDDRRNIRAYRLMRLIPSTESFPIFRASYGRDVADRQPPQIAVDDRIG